MLFPNIGNEYYDERDRAMQARMTTFYSEAITILQSFWGEADTDLRFYTGDQTLWNDLYGNLPANRRRTFNFNRIKPIVQLVSGYQRRNRKSTIVVPMENADAQTADQFTKVIQWIEKNEGVLETISQSFEGALITGMNLLQVYVDYRNDPVSGNIKVDNCSYNSFLIDPYFRKPDLSDCNHLWKRSFLTKEQTVSLLPSFTDEILALQPMQNRDGKFQFMPESYNYGLKNFLTYDEYYYRTFRPQKMMIDAQTGETLEWRHKDEEALRAFLRAYPQVTLIEQNVPTVNLAISIQGKIFYDGPNPLGIDSFPFVPVFSYYHPELPYFPWRIQGIVRGLRDAQYLYNRRRIIELDILESQINSGWIYKEKALVNPNDVFTQAGEGKGLALTEEAQMSDVQRIEAPGIPPSMIQLSELLGNELKNISGVNEELLGSAIDDKAGILSMLRQGAGLTTLQNLFDQLDHAQKLLGKLFIDIVQANFTPGKVQKILEGQQPSLQFYNKAFGVYNAAVEEGLNTINQKQMQLAQMLQLREAGIPIPDDVILDAVTMQNKSQVIESIVQSRQQAQQIEQMQSEITLAELQSKVELNKARAVADQGLGLERASRVQENQALAVERLAQAEKDDDMAFLSKIKALKEIDDIDLAHIHKLLELQKLLHYPVAEKRLLATPTEVGPTSPKGAL